MMVECIGGEWIQRGDKGETHSNTRGDHCVIGAVHRIYTRIKIPDFEFWD